MMRIGIDYTAAVSQGAGIGRYTRGLIGALAEMDHVNDYRLFGAGRDASGKVWPENYSYRPLPITDRHMAIIWQRLRLPLPVELVVGRVDVFHSPDFVLPPVRRARTVLTVHDLSFMRLPECSSPPLLEYLMHSVPRSVARADAILADSESTRRDLIELLGVPADRVTVVYPGYDGRFQPHPDPAPVLRRHGIDGPYILGVGTLQPRKNFGRLIRAFQLLRTRHGLPHRLVISGGKGWLDEDIYSTIAELGLEESVLLTGYTPDEDLPALLTGADVFAFPSLYEGFGIPILEAMGCDTPVVTADVSSLPEVAGDAALLVDPEDVDALADALWRLIDDAALRAELIRRGHGRVQAFSWADSARRLLDVYTQLASNGG